MTLSPEQRRILQDIDSTTAISEADTAWAVNNGLAVLAEDGDIDLTDAGREALAAR